jgi:hypothetical protein
MKLNLSFFQGLLDSQAAAGRVAIFFAAATPAWHPQTKAYDGFASQLLDHGS